MKNAKIIIITAIITLVAGIGIGWLVFHQDSSSEDAGHNHETMGETDKETIWTCAMHPQIRQNEPGLCPICNMDLTPLEETSAASDPELLQMSEHAAKLANVQTSVIGYGNNEGNKITMQGKIEIDERRITKIPAHFHGRIEKLYVNFTGEQVAKGQLLAEVYSPELIAAQEELLQSLKYKESNPPMYKAARNKLKFWKIADSEIERIEQTGEVLTDIKIHSHHGGVVLERHIAQGDHVKMGDILFEIADLSKLWVLFDAYEKDLESIKKGAEIQFNVASLPGENFVSKVSFIDPVIDPQTRVAKVRAEVNNRSGQLKPEMFVNGTLIAPVNSSLQNLLVPQSAVLWTGKQSLVYVKKPGFDQPTFEYRQITIGPEAGEYYVVESGLSPGEKVVTNGAFTIDAAAQLSGKASMMNPAVIDKPEGEIANPKKKKINMSGMKTSKTNKKPENKSKTTETSFWVGGTCDLCKERIEGSLKGVPGILFADWNVDSKMIKVKFDKNKIKENTIHEKISAVGHDTEKMKAKDDVYDNLMECCKYERKTGNE